MASSCSQHGTAWSTECDECAGKCPESERGSTAAGFVYGVVDPDYGRIFSVVRKLAWEEGYALAMHGSFTRDFDLVAVPWTDAACKPERLVTRILASHLGLHEAHGNPGVKPHGRQVWTLLMPEFGDPRFVDLPIYPPVAP